MAETARLLLVGRAGPLTTSLLRLLATVPGVEIVGRVDDLAPALVTASQLGPIGLVLVAGPFAGQTTTVVRQLRAALPDSRCLVLADDVQQQRAVEGAGADAALLWGCRPVEVVATVRALLVPTLAAQPRVCRPATESRAATMEEGVPPQVRGFPR